MDSKSSLSLYLHIPFCKQRCSYCDFNTYTSVNRLRSSYATALAKEIAVVAAGERRPAHTVFFGGGTPSLLSGSDLSVIMESLHDNFILTADAEITLEANPESLDNDYLSKLRELGFNRLSLGVQSKHSEELQLLARTHTFETVLQTVKMSRDAGFTNINLDLIYGLPGQTVEQWQETLSAALEIQPEHLSLYCLTIESGTLLHRQYQSGLVPEPDPDVAADQYDLASDIMAVAGFNQYEISNWALPDYQCEHNLTYWRNGQYLGFGAGAHGHAEGFRYEVVKQPRVYIRRLESEQKGTYPWSLAVAKHHRLSRKEQMTDLLITQLRLTREGLDLHNFMNVFDQSIFAAFPGISEELIEIGLLQQIGGYLLLTKKGRLLSNQVFRRFI